MPSSAEPVEPQRTVEEKAVEVNEDGYAQVGDTDDDA